MAKKLYVENLTDDVNNDDLAQLFGRYGEVVSAQRIYNRDTNRPSSEGIAFVEMSSGADRAVKGLNNQEFRGRPLVVCEMRPRPDRGGGQRQYGNRS